MLKDLQGFTHVYRPSGWFDDAVAVFFVGLCLFALVAAVGEFLGTEIVSVERGQLVVSRGIGRLRRTFRYSVSGIAELVSTDPAIDEKGKRHLQHIFLKPKAGAVRFEYGDKTIYFASSLDEREGEVIAAWLRPKLPRTAVAPLSYEHGGAANFRP